MIRIAAVAFGLGAVATLAAGAQDVALPDALKRAAEYVVQYRTKVSGVTLEEQMMLIELQGTVMRVPRRLASDLVFVDTANGLVGLRDMYAIDTNPVRERLPRISRLLEEPTTVGWQLSQNYSREHAHFFLADVVWWGSEPASVLRFIDAEFQPRITYKLDGKKKVRGVQVIGIGFREPVERGKKYLLETPGNAHCSGRFWIDPATGAIHQTELWVESPTETIRGQITYDVDKTLGLLLPVEGGHTYDAREAGSGISNMGGGSVGRRLSLESTTKYSNARYAKIDLTKIRR